jgi:cytochrome d ubiquinol oxidase subunit II
MVYAVFLPAFYLPVALMLSALIFRGVAFEFRYYAVRMCQLWERGFFIGSFAASFVQGAAIGRMVQELPVVGGQYAGGSFSWLTPFSLFCGVGLVIGYALLGSAWLVLRTDGMLRDWAYRRLGWLLIGTIGMVGVATMYTLFTHPRIMNRWLENSWMIVFPLMILFASVCLWMGIRKRRDWVPYAMAVVIFLGAFLALVGSFWPYMIPFSITIETAAAPIKTLRFLFYGAGAVIFPIVIVYTGMIYWILRGKV